jgi:hypothetical protein
VPKQNNVYKLNLQLDRIIARAAARRIPLEAAHLVIAQNLLPFMYEIGVLGGRTFDVLMSRLPVEKLHERLNFAHSQHLESPTLNDFRATDQLVNLENKALTMARKVITPHAEIAAIFKNKVEKLNWQIPNSTITTSRGHKILFPASALGRKGAYEVRRLAQELQLTVTISGNSIDFIDFWGDVKIEKFNGNFDEVGLVVYPT